MKTIVLTCLLLGAIVVVKGQKDFEDEHRAIIKSCQKEVSGTTDKDVEAVLNHKKDLTPKSKCLQACWLTKLGYMENGMFHAEPEKTLAAFRNVYRDQPEVAAHAEEVNNKCVPKARKESPNDGCEASHIAIQCFVEIISKG